MARRPLPRILKRGSARLTGTGAVPLARGRELARTAADGATDVLHPLITVTRGLRRLAAAGRRRWAETPKDRRGPLVFLVLAVLLVVGLAPYGPLLALVALMAAAAWHGREQAVPVAEGPDEAQAERLRALYDALVPYFTAAGDPSPLFGHGGDWTAALSGYEFDEAGRVSRLTVRYPAYFTDGEPESRARIEQVLQAKAGRGREYHFTWDEEGNELTLCVLPPLPTDITAQRFVTAPGELVLGFTDPTGVQRTVPLDYGEERRDEPPVVWRTGPRSTEPHLLAVGEPGSGTTTLLRSLALQALQHGDVLIVEGGGTGEYACLTGRDGVLAVECALAGAVASLRWATHETERRLIAANRARQAGQPAPDDVRRPLWIFLDRPVALGHLAAAGGHEDPLALLQVPLRHGRAANVTVVVAEHAEHARRAEHAEHAEHAEYTDGLDALPEAVLRHTRARVVLGPAAADLLTAVLGAPPHTTPTKDVPPGRGYARLGAGPVHRLQVPATPDPYDEATGEREREAVLALLPARTEAPGAEEAGRLTKDSRSRAASEPVAAEG
ncbi:MULTISPECIES: hypothetical protein [Streptomyces]|uniref:YD repeat-containing protein n=1 Tax=Streptomyces griseoaurantiacus TaxID=68213 RepID=A0A1G7HXT0_9ACTN|nr:hypothetical protein [Streptomyces jietaisiensis]SDF05357.1 hypothetical protein SAMN05216260_105355 [Streptomyces jietaisiensis]